MSQTQLPVPQDDGDRKVLADVARHGWAVLMIEEDDEGPAFAFSVGLFQTFGHPELLILGLAPPVAQPLVNALGEAIRSGRRFEAGGRCEGVASVPLALVAVDERHYRDYLGYARWFYGGGAFPVLQCVWPDKKGAFPWEVGFDGRFFRAQRILGPAGDLTEGWFFPDPPNVATFTVRQIVREGQPILSVLRDHEEGAWQFLTGGPFDVADGMIVCLSEMVRRDPSVTEVANLLPGWRAWRSQAGAPWQREAMEPEDSTS
jgi:hypothetical protein